MPIYKIITKGEEKPRLVKADSSAQAIRHCAEGQFSAELVSKVEDAAPLFEQGIKLETAGQPPASEPETGGEGQQGESGEESENKTGKAGRTSRQPAGGQEPDGD